jgi:hypothetical protein
MYSIMTTTDDKLDMMTQVQLRVEMEKLPKVKELMMIYEKLYVQIHDNTVNDMYRYHIQCLTKCKNEAALTLVHRPELLHATIVGFDQEIQRFNESITEVRDWDKYFLERKLDQYMVNSYFTLSYPIFARNSPRQP